MGNCAGKPAPPKNEEVNIKQHKQQRKSQWEKTGVVSLRDAKLKVGEAAMQPCQQTFWNGAVSTAQRALTLLKYRR
jgi:hypothetical protein